MNALGICMTAIALTGLVLASIPVSADITVQAGVVYRPLDSWTDITFSRTVLWTQSIEVGSTYVVLEAVTWNIAKIPLADPKLKLLVLTWNPTATSDVAIEFGSSALSGGGAVWFNFTGLRTSEVYAVLVDGGVIATMESGATGRVSFYWDAYGLSHEFVIFVDSSSSPPPVPSEEPWSLEAAAPFCLAFIAAVGIALLVTRKMKRRESR
jgi:hypothetical protein